MLKHWENEMLDTMWSFLQMGGMKANYPLLQIHHENGRFELVSTSLVEIEYY